MNRIKDMLRKLLAECEETARQKQRDRLAVILDEAELPF